MGEHRLAALETMDGQAHPAFPALGRANLHPEVLRDLSPGLETRPEPAVGVLDLLHPIFLPSQVNGPPVVFSESSLPAYFVLTFQTKSISLMIALSAMRDSMMSSIDA